MCAKSDPENEEPVRYWGTPASTQRRGLVVNDGALLQVAMFGQQFQGLPEGCAGGTECEMGLLWALTTKGGKGKWRR